MDLSSSEGSLKFESKENKLQRRRERARRGSETATEKLRKSQEKLKSEEQLAFRLQRYSKG